MYTTLAYLQKLKEPMPPGRNLLMQFLRGRISPADLEARIYTHPTLEEEIGMEHYCELIQFSYSQKTEHQAIWSYIHERVIGEEAYLEMVIKDEFALAGLAEKEWPSLEVLELLPIPFLVGATLGDLHVGKNLPTYGGYDIEFLPVNSSMRWYNKWESKIGMVTAIATAGRHYMTILMGYDGNTYVLMDNSGDVFSTGTLEVAIRNLILQEDNWGIRVAW